MDDNKPRLIGRKEAAAYCGISPSAFSTWVSTHKMPPPIPGTRKWDRRAIDARLDEVSGLTPGEQEDPYDKWMRENQPGYNSKSSTGALREWQERQKQRERHRPQLGLDAKLQRILYFMDSHPDCNTIDQVPGAGPKSIKKPLKAGAIDVAERGELMRYRVSDTGREELSRIESGRRTHGR